MSPAAAEDPESLPEAKAAEQQEPLSKLDAALIKAAGEAGVAEVQRLLAEGADAAAQVSPAAKLASC